VLFCYQKAQHLAPSGEYNSAELWAIQGGQKLANVMVVMYIDPRTTLLAQKHTLLRHVQILLHSGLPFRSQLPHQSTPFAELLSYGTVTQGSIASTAIWIYCLATLCAPHFIRRDINYGVVQLPVCSSQLLATTGGSKVGVTYSTVGKWSITGRVRCLWIVLLFILDSTLDCLVVPDGGSIGWIYNLQLQQLEVRRSELHIQ